MRLTPTAFEPVTDVIHGVAVVDPYRWLEDRTLPETEAWIREQQGRCDDYFSDLPGFEEIRNRVREYLDIEVVDQPVRVANTYFYRRRVQGQEQACIYVRDIATGEERLLVDPSQEGTFVSVGIHRVSSDGSLLAYELRHGGEDKKSIHIYDLTICRALADELRNGYARGFAFATDGKGFFYCHETDEAASDHAINLHLFHGNGPDQAVFRVTRSRESRLILIADAIHLGAIWIQQLKDEMVSDFFVARQDRPRGWRRVFTSKKLPCSPILRQGRLFLLDYERTPNGSLVELGMDGEEIGTRVPERAMIRQLLITGDIVYVRYLEDLIPTICHWDLSGNHLGEIDIPIDGTVRILSNQSLNECRLFYTYESFAHRLTIYEYSPTARASAKWHQTNLPSNTVQTSTVRMSFPARDGTKIPITLVASEGVKLRSGNPLIMTSYGGFGASMTPQFSVLVTVLMEQGFVFALPHIRGGGEFGKAWHEAARGRLRQMAFDDFIAATEWLGAEGVAALGRLGIFGGSNSGLLVAAAMTQRPELFQAVLCIALLLDMVRYETFDQAIKWRHEYGSVEREEDFRALYAYSPYHGIVGDVDYPATLFISGDKDDRCNPAHVRKMSACMQGRSAQIHPILVDYCELRGHSPVLPLFIRIDALARRIAFFSKELCVRIPVGGIL